MTEPADRWIVWGTVGRPHGIRGELRVFPAGDGTAFEIPAETTLRLRIEDQQRAFTLRSMRGAGKFRIVALDEITSRDEASHWTHAELLLDPSLLPELSDEDVVYVSEVVGFDVVDEQGASLGRVLDIVDYGAGDVLVYGRGRQQEMLPFASPWVLEIDDTLQLVRVNPDWIE